MKTITGYLNDDRPTRTARLYQYDTGVRLAFQGDLPEEYEVHFGTNLAQPVTVVPGDGNGVRIPDELLATGEPLLAWVYATDADGGHTEYSMQIPVERRAPLPTPEVSWEPDAGE